MASRNQKDHRYTPEEDKWLADNLNQYTYPQLTELFNEKFGTNIKSVSDRCIKRLGLHKEVNRGSIPKGVRINANTRPIGAESFDGKVLWIKISNEINDCKNGRNPCKQKDVNWVRKSRYIWEKKHGQLTKDDMIVYLNKDPMDCSIENLYCTTRAINFMMAKNGWYTESREHTITALKWCELYYAIKNGGVRNGEIRQ